MDKNGALKAAIQQLLAHGQAASSKKMAMLAQAKKAKAEPPADETPVDCPQCGKPLVDGVCPDCGAPEQGDDSPEALATLFEQGSQHGE